MIKKVLVCLSLAALCLTSAGLVGAQETKPQENPPRDPSVPLTRSVDPHGPGRPNENVPVNIIYDDGIVTAVPAVGSMAYGNQFNSASGMVIKSFSLTQISAFIVTGAGSDNVFVSVFGPVNGTTAPVLGSANLPLNNGSGAFNTFSVGPYVGGSSFLAGIWYVAGDTVGLGSGTANGQGHHGMLINDIVGTGFTTLPGLNALVGAATAFIVPVELMSFSISDE